MLWPHAHAQMLLDLVHVLKSHIDLVWLRAFSGFHTCKCKCTTHVLLVTQSQKRCMTCSLWHLYNVDLFQVNSFVSLLNLLNYLIVESILIILLFHQWLKCGIRGAGTLLYITQNKEGNLRKAWGDADSIVRGGGTAFHCVRRHFNG